MNTGVEGPPDGGHGDSCSRRGAGPARMHPPFLFCLAKRETGRARSKEKSVGALRCSGPPRARGSAYRCLLRFCLAVGHAMAFCEVGTAVPWRMVPTASGWLSHGPASIFAAAGCSSKKRERQRGESLRVSLTAPGQRFPQERRVSVPDRRKGLPTFPRRRQEVCACADRPAEHFFFSTGRGAFSF